MSATDELRCMLDERGVEYHQTTIENIASYLYLTTWDSPDGHSCEFHEIVDGEELTHRLVAIRGWELTPEQVIAMTLGRKTCHNVIGEGDFVCSECGAFVHARNENVGKSHVDEDGVRWYGTSYEHNFNYCPNCGARIEVD